MEINVKDATIVLTLKNYSTNRAKEGIDCALAAALQFCRQVSGEHISPALVNLTRLTPNNRQTFDDFFNCTVNFNEKSDHIIFSKDVLDKTLPGSSSALSNHLEEIVQRNFTTSSQAATINRATSIILNLLPTGKATEELVANHFNCSTRQLQRKLKNEGTSFRELLDNIRKELAKQYICENHLSITEVAYLVGFSNRSNFSRAFKKWVGLNPAAYKMKVMNADL